MTDAQASTTKHQLITTCRPAFMWYFT